MVEHKTTKNNAAQGSSDTNADRILSGMFLVGLTGISFLAGFGRAFAAAKKQDKAVNTTVVRAVEANSLALKALGWGSLFAITGVSLISLSIWKISGASNMLEFREAVGNFLPKIPKKENGGRTEFNTVTELFQYLIDEDEKNKTKKS